eukprot:5536151-Heterocapsa_arctica.AAC.1
MEQQRVALDAEAAAQRVSRRRRQQRCGRACEISVVDHFDSVTTPTAWQTSRTRVLLDSGRFIHPPTFAPEIPFRKDNLRWRAVTANGQPLKCYDRKR